MSQILREREMIFNIFRDVWKGQIFLWVGFTKGYRGTSDKWKDTIQVLRNLWTQFFVIH